MGFSLQWDGHKESDENKSVDETVVFHANVLTLQILNTLVISIT